MLYKTYVIRINNAKTGTTEYREYAISVKKENEHEALEAVRKYAERCMKRYRKGSTYVITEIITG